MAATGFFTFLMAGGGRWATAETGGFVEVPPLLELLLPPDAFLSAGSGSRDGTVGPAPLPLGPGPAPGMSLVGSRPIGRTALPRPPLPTVEGEAGAGEAGDEADGAGEAVEGEGLPTVEFLGAGVGAVLARGVLGPPTIDILVGTAGAFFLGSDSSEDEEGDEVARGDGSTSGEEETGMARDPESEAEAGVDEEGEDDPEEDVLGDFGGLAAFWVLGFFPTEVETEGDEVAIEEEAEEEVPKMAWRADSSKRWDWRGPVWIPSMMSSRPSLSFSKM